MSIFDKIRGEFIDIIEWLDDTQDTIVYRFDRYNNEIKMGAKLTVRESQMAVFVNEGQVADVYPPGMYTLETQNMPILSTIKGWKYGFNSPFKAEVYFVNTKRFTDLKWGTANPVMMRDSELGVVRVRAYGTYGMRIADPGKFLREIAGTDWQFTTEEVSEHLRNQIVAKFSESVAQAGIPVIDLASRYSELGEKIRTAIVPGLAEIGVDLVNFLIENVSVPEDVEKAIDSRTSIGAVGNLDDYMKFQAGKSMEKAAENPGGLGAAGVGMGMGAAMGGMMQNASHPATPPATPPAIQYHLAVNGQPTGPYDISALAAHGLTKDSMVWMSGWADWKRAGDVPELAGAMPATPPPIPGQ